MSKIDDTKKPKEEVASHQESMIAVGVTGKDSKVWVDRKPRFLERLINSVKMLFGADIPASATANQEFQDTVDSMAKSAQEALKGPQLVNEERQASINLKLAEAKERAANARKVGLEADLLEAEVRKTVHESQKIVNLSLQRGELKLFIEDGKITFVFNKRKL